MIEELDEPVGRSVKKEVEKKASNEGFLPDPDKVLEEEHFLKQEEKGRVESFKR